MGRGRWRLGISIDLCSHFGFHCTDFSSFLYLFSTLSIAWVAHGVVCLACMSLLATGVLPDGVNGSDGFLFFFEEARITILIDIVWPHLACLLYVSFGLPL